MDRFTKINEIKRLEDAIKKQKQIIEMEKERLHSLENEYSKSNVVELPVLLFIIVLILMSQNLFLKKMKFYITLLI